MKKILSLLIILLFSTSAFAVDNPWDTKLPFKNAIIKSEISGTMIGEKTVYIKDYGRTRAEYSNTSMKMFGISQKQKEIIITDPDWVYTIDLVENSGTKQANPKKFMIQEFNNLSKSDKKKVVKNAESQGIATVEGMEGNLEKNAAKILGYNCDKVTMTGAALYSISGTDLVLKMNGDMMGVKINQVATSVKKESAPSSKFKLPSNIKFEHNQQADQMMQNQAKTMIQNLVEGKSLQMSGEANNTKTNSQPPAPPQESKAASVLKEDAKDVGSAARQEAKDNTIEEVKEGVQSLFKSIFD